MGPLRIPVSVRRKNETKNREFDFNVVECAVGENSVSRAYSYGATERYGSGLVEGHSDTHTGQLSIFRKEEEMKEEKIHFTDTQLLDLLDEGICTVGFQKLMQRFINSYPDLIPRPHYLGASYTYTFRYLMDNYFNKIEKLGLGNKSDLVVDHEKSVSESPSAKNYYADDSKRLDWLCTKRGSEWVTAYLTYYSTSIDRDAIDTVMGEEQ
jgi:hypothetical protein